MKKSLALLFISMTTMACVSFGTIKYTSARAEEEAAVEVAESNEDKYKEMYEEAVKKYNEISNFQILGTTVGTLIGALVALGLTFLHNKINSGQVNKLYELSRKTEDKFNRAEKIVEEYKTKAENAIAEVKEYKALSIELFEELKQEKENTKKLLQIEMEKRDEERKFFLSIVMHSKDMVASGAAEELVEYFKKD